MNEIEKLEHRIALTHSYIDDSRRQQSELVRDASNKGYRERTVLRSCLSRYETELYAAKILQLCHTGR